MDHHEQHHQHHEKERAERIRHEKERERQSEKRSYRIHPAWFVAGAVLVLVAILICVLLVWPRW